MLGALHARVLDYCIAAHGKQRKESQIFISVARSG
jgi:hypothetical protein